MDYDLAKKLKDAGFPQDFRMGHWICEHELLDPTITDATDNCHGEQLVYHPTLSELIKACGDDFRGIERGPLNKSEELYWFAGMIKNRSIIAYAKTPEESVAKLWLELNKKK